jgi:hypothetical protein
MIEARRSGPPFGAIDNSTAALPDADAPRVIDIHDSPLCAVHEQPARTDTRTSAAPPPAAASMFVVLRSKRHGAGSCVSSIRVEATTTAPSREDGTPFGPTRNDTCASPCPLSLPSTAIHGISEATCHVQSRGAEMTSVPAPPSGGNVVALVVALTAHLSALGAATDTEEDEQPDASPMLAMTHTSEPATRTGRPRSNRLASAHGSAHTHAGSAGFPIHTMKSVTGGATP